MCRTWSCWKKKFTILIKNDYQIIWLQPSVSVPEGFIAIQQGWDALGEVRDALYNQTADFQFRDNDIALAYGVNHAMTGKSVYSNISCYGKKYQDGFGGITNFNMEKSARKFIADTAIADKFFAYSFARHPVPGDSYVFIVPSDTNGTLEGINVNDTAYLGFRSYINTLTKIGPDPMEVILDRTVLLRPGSSGIAGSGRQISTMKVYPNPVTDKTTLEFSVPDWSDITLSLYNSTGQQVGKAIRIDHVRGTVMQEMKLSGNLPSGIYYIHGIANEQSETGRQTFISKLVYLGVNGM